jgi:hypothetical protein
VASPRVVRVLSVHEGYACRHSGRCCSSNWPIALTPDSANRVRLALGSNGVAGTPDGVAVLGRVNGVCVFREADPSAGCRIHRMLGHAALPLECRQFPRQSVTDPRGTSVTLSHYCPTARAQLDRQEGAITIREDAEGFPRTGEYVGLDATADLPPLLHPRCLLDWETWWVIETRAVSLIGGRAESALPRLAIAVEHMRTWRPTMGSLHAHVSLSFDVAAQASIPAWRPSDALIAAHVADARAAVPPDWQADADQALAARQPPLAWPVFGRFLAAHAFANWAAYRGQGLRTWYRSIEAAGCLAWRTGDPGSADLVLRHLADSSALITRWSQAEEAGVIRPS